MLGEDHVNKLVKKKKLPAPPMALATAPAHDPDLDRIISAEVASELITRVAGKRLATSVGRRIPVVGGLVGAGADGFATWQDRPLRRPRVPAPRPAVAPARSRAARRGRRAGGHPCRLPARSCWPRDRTRFTSWRSGSGRPAASGSSRRARPWRRPAAAGRTRSGWWTARPRPAAPATGRRGRR